VYNQFTKTAAVVVVVIVSYCLVNRKRTCIMGTHQIGRRGGSPPIIAHAGGGHKQSHFGFYLTFEGNILQ
jgi:hypothetical protein